MIYDEPEALPFAARHWLGAALLEAKRPADAERVYREDLKKHPHNGWSLFGLKQALGDPWEDALKKYPVGAVVEAPVTNLAKFGAFVDLGGGVEGMIHIGDISADKRLNHPNEALKQGEVVRAVVLEADRDRRRVRLGIKQLQPTSIDEYLAEHKAGEVPRTSKYRPWRVKTYVAFSDEKKVVAF